MSSSIVQKETAMLIQIASRDRVFLLDVLALGPVLTAKDWELFVTHFFNNNSIRVLGYGLGSDYAALENVHPVLMDLVGRSCCNWLDLCLLAHRITTGMDKLFDLTYDNGSLKGLTGLSKGLLGKELDKTYQICDWSKRPLRREQLEYAAIDAYVCVAIYQEFENVAQAFDKQQLFGKWCGALVKYKNKLPKGFSFRGGGGKSQASAVKEKPRVQKLVPPTKPLNENPIDPPDLKVVCDTMLQGLCKKLRLRGVDAIGLENHEHFELCAEVANKEGRMILSRGTHAQRLQSMVRKGHCYSVIQDKTEDQIEEVFWYFNVTPDDKYVFTRCPKCNNVKYAAVEGYQALIVHDNQSGTSAKGYYEKEDDDEDDYTRFLDPDEYGDSDEDEITVPAANLSQHFICGDFEVEKCSGIVKGTTVRLQLDAVPRKVIQDQHRLYGCTKCGKMFWEGSHWDRFLNRSSNK